MNGMTIKQFNRRNFWLRLDEYRNALKSGESGAIVRASIAVNAACTSKDDKRLMHRTYRDTKAA